MKAVRLHNYGDISNLKLDVIDEPICNENQIKVNIKATSINHLDVWVRKGIDKSIKLPMIIGSDGSGKIVEIGKNINKNKVGDKVLIQPGLFCKECRYCLSGKENYCKKYSVLGEDQDGTMADFICLNEENICLMPNHLNFIEAAAMPLVFMTAYQMLYKRANIKKNDILLIYGGY